MGNTHGGEDSAPLGAKRNRNFNTESILRVGSDVFSLVHNGDGSGEMITLKEQATNYDHAHKAALYNLRQANGSDPNGGVPGIVGFRNMGNTCYMNSALQCLANTVPLTDYFLGYDFRKEINATNPLGTGGEIASAYATLMKKIWLETQKSQGTTRSISLKRFRSKICRFASQFEGDEQHDAHEFLLAVLDKIHEDLNRVQGIKPFVEESDNDGESDQEKAATEAWQRYLQRDKSVIVDMFQGQLRSVTKCSNCRSQNIRFDAFMYLSLPINDSSKSLDDCIADFVKVEEMTGNDQWFCRKCQKLVDATKKTDLWVLPPVLIIQLKRFMNLGTGEKSVKVNTKLKYPIQDWDLSDVVLSGGALSVRFDLYASLNHFGDLDVGHYTSFILNQFDKQWYEFDDNEHRMINPISAFRSSPSPYILFYGRSSALKSRVGPSVNRQSTSHPSLWPHLQGRRNSKSRFRSASNSHSMMANELKSIGADIETPEPMRNGTGVMSNQFSMTSGPNLESEVTDGLERTLDYEEIEEIVMRNFEVAGCLQDEMWAPAGVVGLRNLDNTSFMNSALQCLSNTSPLTDYFLGFDYQSAINSDNILGSNNGELVTAYADLIEKIWLKTSPKRRVIVAKGFKKAMLKFAPRFRDKQMHDAHEFLTILLDGLHEDLNQVEQNDVHKESTGNGENDTINASQSWELYLKRQDSIIVDLFQGQLRNTCVCSICANVSTRFEAFMYLSLPIDTNTSSLHHCMLSFIREEKLVGANSWYCPHCGKHVEATKKHDFWVLPPVLIIQLKRFCFQRDGATKLDTELNYPVTDWDLSSLVQLSSGDEVTYDLCASSNHLGSLNSGHYTAYARNRFNNQWYEFNDNKVRAIDPTTAFESSNLPYLLFYVRSESND